VNADGDRTFPNSVLDPGPPRAGAALFRAAEGRQGVAAAGEVFSIFRRICRTMTNLPHDSERRRRK
jgi:hypothetical protein